MTIALSPRWKPIALPTPCAPAATPLFDPIIVQDLGLYVNGGPNAVVVFGIGKPPGIVCTIGARVWITGFAVAAGSLYVQDGPVLLVHSLTFNRLAAAINLITGERWSGEDGDDLDRDALYALSDADAVLQRALISAHLAYADALVTGNNPAKAGIEDMKATMAAARVIFSPPVVRGMQADARNDAVIFSLGMDGKVYPLTDNLQLGEVYEGKAPANPHLLLVERPEASGNILCHLYYVAKDGSIVVIDAGGDLEEEPGWQSKGGVMPSRVLPLRYVDGYLMGAGVLGAGFFVCSLDPSKPPILTVGSASAWKEFDVAVAEKLVLLSDGASTRLVSYAPAAKQKDRWGLRNMPALGYAIFWRGTGVDALVPTPKLTFEFETTASSPTTNVGFRVGLANTIDSIDPAFTSTYPPPFLALDSGTLGPGAFTGVRQISWIACRPVVANQTLYCMVRSAPPATAGGTMALAAFSLDGASGALVASANAGLDNLRRLAYPPRLVISRYDKKSGESKKPDGWDPRGPYVLNNRAVTIILNGQETVVNTDNDGAALFDSTKSGSSVSPKWQAIPAIWAATVTGATLETGKTVEIRINATGYRD